MGTGREHEKRQQIWLCGCQMGKLWEVYNFRYADKEKRRNLNTEDHSWLSEKSQVEASQWRCEHEKEVPVVGEREWKKTWRQKKKQMSL